MAGRALPLPSPDSWVSKKRLVEVSYPGPGLQHAMTKIKVFQTTKSVSKLRVGLSKGLVQSCGMVKWELDAFRSPEDLEDVCWVALPRLISGEGLQASNAMQKLVSLHADKEPLLCSFHNPAIW